MMTAGVFLFLLWTYGVYKVGTIRGRINGYNRAFAKIENRAALRTAGEEELLEELATRRLHEFEEPKKLPS